MLRLGSRKHRPFRRVEAYLANFTGRFGVGKFRIKVKKEQDSGPFLPFFGETFDTLVYK